MNIVPIGIVTHNRARYLDITLRSLSATKLPEEQVVVVFDDASDDSKTLKYLYSNDVIDLSQEWPSSKQWHDHGLGIVKSRHDAIGIKNIVPIVLLDNIRQGVVDASCNALRELYKMFPDADKVILLQDDVIFNTNWFDRLIDSSKTTVDPPPGIIAGSGGIGGSRDPDKNVLNLIVQANAMCILVTLLGKKIVDKWINEKHYDIRGFDGLLCIVIRENNAGVYAISPSICQHIGIVSKVWPDPNEKSIGLINANWNRVDRSAHGPYAMSSQVRNFMPKV